MRFLLLLLFNSFIYALTLLLHPTKCTSPFQILNRRYRIFLQIPDFIQISMLEIYFSKLQVTMKTIIYNQEFEPPLWREFLTRFQSDPLKTGENNFVETLVIIPVSLLFPIIFLLLNRA